MTCDINLDAILKDCLDAAKFAGAYLNERYGTAIRAEKMASLPDGVDPSVFNVVTNVDLELQREVARMLMTKYLDFEFFGEEKLEKVFDPDVDAELIQRIRDNRCRYQFVVDPLDGTSRYADRDARHGFFAGLLDGIHFVLSVGYSPKQDSLTHAVKGQGCFRNGKTFVFDSTVDDHIIINSKAAKKSAFVNQLQSQGLFLMVPKHTGTMYDMLFQQYAPAMISLKTNTHDHPLSLAVQEAGGAVLVHDGERFVKGDQFNWRSETSKKDANIPAYIAANTEKQAWRLAEMVSEHL